jgi:hypothetical protein
MAAMKHACNRYYEYLIKQANTRYRVTNLPKAVTGHYKESLKFRQDRSRDRSCLNKFFLIHNFGQIDYLYYLVS